MRRWIGMPINIRGGGFMLVAEGFGHVFLTPEDIDEDLRFVSRADAGSRQGD
jgi:hypothetical protein